VRPQFFASLILIFSDDAKETVRFVCDSSASPHGAPHLRRGDRAEQAVRFVVGPGGKEERVGRAGGSAVAEANAPQAVDLDRPVVGALHDAVLFPAVLAPAERVDPAVPEVADQQVTAELAEVRRCHRETPRCVELAGRRDPLDEVARRVEGIDVAAALARDLFVAVLVLLRVGDVDQAADVLDTERRVALGQGRVGERAREIARVPRAVKHVDGAGVEVGRVQVVHAADAADRQAEINRVRRGDRLDRDGPDAVPAVDAAALGGEDEARWHQASASVDLEVARAVEHLTRRAAGHGHDQAELRPGVAVVQGRFVRPLVGDPPRGGCAVGHPPAVDEVRIGVLGHAGDVRLELADAVQVLRVWVPCGCRQRHAEQQSEARGKREGTSWPRHSS
jgi:hypothetical protein